MYLGSAGGGRLTVKPFLKWAGGKRWLARDYPDLFGLKFKRYIEPFVGSGAIFFSLRPTSAIISDVNKELIQAYCAVRDDWEAVWDRLEILQEKHSKDFYYEIRAYEFADSYDSAARFIYLNRTCWNVLYRVNLRGQFNVPLGTKTDVLIGGSLADVADALKTRKFGLAISRRP